MERKKAGIGSRTEKNDGGAGEGRDARDEENEKRAELEAEVTHVEEEDEDEVVRQMRTDRGKSANAAVAFVVMLVGVTVEANNLSAEPAEWN